MIREKVISNQGELSKEQLKTITEQAERIAKLEEELAESKAAQGKSEGFKFIDDIVEPKKKLRKKKDGRYSDKNAARAKKEFLQSLSAESPRITSYNVCYTKLLRESQKIIILSSYGG